MLVCWAAVYACATALLTPQHARLPQGAGVTVDGQPSCEEYGELRNMILAMVDEPLAILIKLADRLHNMRTVNTIVKVVAIANIFNQYK